MRDFRAVIGVEMEAGFMSTTLLSITDELLFVSMTASCIEIDLDLGEPSYGVPTSAVQGPGP